MSDTTDAMKAMADYNAAIKDAVLDADSELGQRLGKFFDASHEITIRDFGPQEELIKFMPQIDAFDASYLLVIEKGLESLATTIVKQMEDSGFGIIEREDVINSMMIGNVLMSAYVAYTIPFYNAFVAEVLMHGPDVAAFKADVDIDGFMEEITPFMAEYDRSDDLPDSLQKKMEEILFAGVDEGVTDAEIADFFENLPEE